MLTKVGVSHEEVSLTLVMTVSGTIGALGIPASALFGYLIWHETSQLQI